MPTREVDLIIRARDEARAAFQATVESLERLKTSSREAGAAVDQYGGEAAQAAQQVRDLRVESAQVAASIQQQEAAIERSTAAQRRLSQESQRAARSQQTFTNQQARLADRLTMQDNRLRVLRTRYDELRATLATTGAPARALVQEFDRLGAAIPRTEARIRELGDEQRLAAAAAEEAAQAQRRAGAQQAQQAATTARLVRELRSLRESYRNLGTSVRTAERNQARIERTMERAAGASRQLGTANRQAAASQSQLASTFQQFLGGSRQSLSFFQRLRGEILALVTAYGGLFAAFQGVSRVLEATGTIQSAQNRIAVALGTDDIQRINAEFDFLRRTADRLGVSFGVLLQEYSQFAVATRGTNLAGQDTRDIFLSVAEAARVQNLSLDQVQGTFLALTQIVSRGAVSMEELRRQLGDRIPGAVPIFAAALDLTTRELVELVETGRLSADTLVDFAEELDARFGPRLPNALETITAAMGRFQNQVFQTFNRIGEAGAIEGLIDLFDRLAELFAGEQFRSFLERVGAGLGVLAQTVAFLAENFDVLLTVIGALLGRRIGTLVLGIARSFRDWRRDAAAALQVMRLTNATTAQSVGIFTRAAISVRALAISVGGLVAATGVGIIFGAIGAAIAAWVTSTDDATEALVRHERLVDRIRNAYDEANGEVETFRENIEGITVAGVAQSLRETEEQIQALRMEGTRLTSEGFFRLFFGGAVSALVGQRNPLEEQLDRFTAQFRAGALTGTEYREVLDGLQQSARSLGPEFTDLVVAAQEWSERLEAAQQRGNELTDTLTILTGNVADAQDAFDRMGNRLDSVDNSIEAQIKALAEYTAALRELSSEVPALAGEIDRLGRLRSLAEQRDQLFQLADAAGVARREVRNIFDRAVTAVDADAIFGTVSDGLVSASNLFRETAALFGPDLAREVIRIGALLREELGDSVVDALNARQQAIVAEVVRVTGQLPPELAEAIRRGMDTGSALGVQAVLRNIEGLENPEFFAEVFGFGDFDSGPLIAELQRAEAERERLAERERRRQERLAEQEARRIERQRQATRDQLSDLGFQIDQQRLINAGLDRQAFIEEQIRQAKEANLNIDQRSLTLVRLRAGVLFDLQNQENEREEQLRRIQEAEQRVNDLLDLRSQLEQQILQTRDQLRAAQLRETVDALGPEIREATDRALELAEAFEGDDIAVRTLISRLQVLRQEGTETARDIILRFDDLRNAFAGALTMAAQGFIDTILEGQNAITGLANAFRSFAADFLRRIADMILQQLALNAAMAVFGGASGSGFNLTGLIGGLFGGGGGAAAGAAAGGLPVGFRTGGLVSSTGHPLRIPNMFQTGGLVGASGSPVRLPNAGTAGFGDAFPAILHRGEEVLTADNPRNILNGGGGATVVEPKIVNAVDAPGILDAAVSDVRGQQVFFNFIAANRSAMRSAIGN